jgi:O-antigen/teichoic acid export membrane protein
MAPEAGNATRLASRLINNAIFNLFGTIWPILLALITTPYIVHGLGLEPYGVLVLVSAVLGYVLLLDLGLDASLVKYVAQYRAVEDFETLRTYIGTALIIYAMVGLTGCLIIGGLTNPLVGLLKIAPDLRPVAQFVFYVGAVGFLVNLISGAFRAVVTGFQRYDLSNLIDVSAGTVQSIGTVALLWQGLALKEVVLFQLAISLVKLGLFAFVSSKLVPGSLFRLTFAPTILKNLVNFGLMTFINRIAGLFLFQFDRTYIGFVLGGASITYYSIPDNLGRQMHSLPASATSASFPLASELTSAKQSQTVRRLYLRGLKWGVALAFSMTAVLVALSFKVLYYWMGSEFAGASAIPLRLLLISYCVFAFTAIPSKIVDGVGLPRYNALFASLSAGLNFIACIFLIPRWGILGAAIANTLPVVVVPPYLAFVERRILGIKTLDHWFSIYIPSLGAASLTFLLVYLLQYYWVNNLIQVVIAAGLGMVIFAVWAFIFGVFGEEDKKSLLEYLDLLTTRAKLIVQRLTYLAQNR